MKKLGLGIATLLLFSCSNNNLTNNASISPSPSNINKNSETDTSKIEINYLELAKTLEEKLDNQPVSGITTDNLGNTYIISKNGKIIRIDKSTNSIESKDNNMDIAPFVNNVFFNLDSKGNGYFIPERIVIDDTVTDPVTGKSKVFSNNTFPIYKIANLKIADTYNVEMETARFIGHCLAEDDCSDLYLSFGGKNNSLNEFLKSQKKFIEDNNYHSGSPDLSSIGNDIYVREDNDIATLYTYTNGVDKKTDISATPLFYMNFNINQKGNGFIIYNQTGKNKFAKIQNYLIGNVKDLNREIDEELYRKMYHLPGIINEQGNGFVIYNNIFSPINNFKTDINKLYLLDKDLKGLNISIDNDGNGYLASNKFEGLGPNNLGSIYKPKIFIVRNYNLIM